MPLQQEEVNCQLKIFYEEIHVFLDKFSLTVTAIKAIIKNYYLDKRDNISLRYLSTRGRRLDASHVMESQSAKDTVVIGR